VHGLHRHVRDPTSSTYEGGAAWPPVATALLTDGVSLLQIMYAIDLYSLAVHIFELAAGIRLFHAGQHDILPRRGVPHDHLGFDHRFVLSRG
jgi:hypothetical protein